MTPPAKPAWEPISQARMIAENISCDLQDATHSVTLEQRVRHTRAAMDRYKSLGERLERALRELAQCQ